MALFDKLFTTKRKLGRRESRDWGRYVKVNVFIHVILFLSVMACGYVWRTERRLMRLFFGPHREGLSDDSDAREAGTAASASMWQQLARRGARAAREPPGGAPLTTLNHCLHAD